MASGRRVARIGVAAVLVAVLAAALWSRAVIVPRTDLLPAHVDAIVQLGGVGPDDYLRSRDLAGQGRTGDLVVSTYRLDQATRATVCAPLAGVRVHCFDPDPATTRGEAREAARLADEHGWTSMAVYTTARPHVGRTRYVVGRCYDGQLLVDSHRRMGGPREAVGQWIYQSGAWIKALSQDGC